MRIGLVQDGGRVLGPDGPGAEHTIEEIVEEAVLADQLGFDFFGLAEVHFSPVMTMSAPDVVLAYIAARTEQIRLRFVSTPLLAFNHPLRVAERVAMLDHLSSGRIELGTARSNQAHTIQAFGIDVNDTRAQFRDSLDVVIGALGQDAFEHDGPVWKIPKREIYPRPVQRPHPPVFASATSLETHTFAGHRGIGCMSGNSLPGGWEFVDQCLGLYRDAWRDAAQWGGATNRTFSSLALRAHCAPTNDQALREAEAAAFDAIELVLKWYTKLAETSSDYSYMATFQELDAIRDDLPALIDRAPYITIGDPDFFLQRIDKLERMGVDEFILEIDGLGHDKQMSAIELIGTEVLPHVNRTEERVAR